MIIPYSKISAIRKTRMIVALKYFDIGEGINNVMRGVVKSEVSEGSFKMAKMTKVSGFAQGLAAR